MGLYSPNATYLCDDLNLQCSDSIIVSSSASTKCRRLRSLHHHLNTSSTLSIAILRQERANQPPTQPFPDARCHHDPMVLARQPEKNRQIVTDSQAILLLSRQDSRSLISLTSSSGINYSRSPVQPRSWTLVLLCRGKVVVGTNIQQNTWQTRGLVGHLAHIAADPSRLGLSMRCHSSDVRLDVWSSVVMMALAT